MKHLIPNLKKLITKSRPVFWFVMAVAYCWGFYFTHLSISAIFIIQFLAFTFPFSLFLYGINDIYDYESDLVNPRKQKNIGGAAADKRIHKLLLQVSIVSVVVFLIISLSTGKIYNIISAIILIIVSYFYSAPPIRIKTKPPLDSFVNGFMYILLPFTMGYSLLGSFDGYPVKIIFVALCSMAFHALTAVPDINFDKAAGDKTLAIVLGRRSTILMNVIAYTISYFWGGFTSIYIRAFLIVIAIGGSLLCLKSSFAEKYLWLYIKAIYVCFYVVTVLVIFF